MSDPGSYIRNLESFQSFLSKEVDVHLRPPHWLSMFEVAAGLLPDVPPRLFEFVRRPGAGARWAPAASAEAAFTALRFESGALGASHFDLSLGMTRSGAYLAPSSGRRTLAVTGRPFEGKGLYLRYLVQQFLAHGWRALIITNGGFDWSAFGAVITAARPDECLRQVGQAWPEAAGGERVVVVVDADGFDGQALSEFGLIARARDGFLLKSVTAQHFDFGQKLSGVELELLAFERVIEVRSATSVDQDAATSMRAWSNGQPMQVVPQTGGAEQGKLAGRALLQMLALQGARLALSKAYAAVAIARGFKSWHALAQQPVLVEPGRSRFSI